ncbi:MAG: ribosome biogenesis GTPase YlqF, partial [Anaeroplasmataceae bacterium]
SMKAIEYLIKLYPKFLEKRYDIDLSTIDTTNILNVVDFIGKKRGCLLKKEMIDYERVFKLIINDIRTLKLGAMTFDRL